MPQPVFETGLPRPQRGALTTILLRPGDIGYRSRHLSHAKRALYHLSYIPLVLCYKILVSYLILKFSKQLTNFKNSVTYSIMNHYDYTINYLSFK